MAAKSSYGGPSERLELYETVVAGNPAVARKGAKNPYTSRNGHMFSFLDGDGTMALRLSDELAAKFTETYESGPVEQHGRTMRQYVAVPSSLLEKPGELQTWFDQSHDWIGTLKPKPTSNNKSRK